MILSKSPLAREVHTVPSIRSKERDRVAACNIFFIIL